MLYLEIITRNSLTAKIEGRTPRYRTTQRGLEALQHFRKLEAMIPELAARPEEEGILS